MKYKITIKKQNEIIFDGKLIDLPIKKDILKQKSFEIFADNEPCIIHQAFVIETFCDALISRYKDQIDQEIELSKDIKEIEFIDIKNMDQAKIIIRRK
jgi:hypothetical protein